MNQEKIIERYNNNLIIAKDHKNAVIMTVIMCVDEEREKVIEKIGELIGKIKIQERGQINTSWLLKQLEKLCQTASEQVGHSPTKQVK